MMQKNFIGMLQKKIAVSAIGPSTLRGQAKGSIGIAREFLSDINLANVPQKDKKQFDAWLDRKTKRLTELFPGKKKPWGAARKSLNLFMRDVLYNKYTCNEYNIKKIEKWLEIPLDSAVARGLKIEDLNRELPAWPGLKWLEKKVSDRYQDFARESSRRRKIATVHLDIFLWLENR